MQIKILGNVIKNLNKLDYPPRTKKILDSIDFKSERLILVEPLSYLEFNFLIKNI